MYFSIFRLSCESSCINNSRVPFISTRKPSNTILCPFNPSHIFSSRVPHRDRLHKPDLNLIKYFLSDCQQSFCVLFNLSPTFSCRLFGSLRAELDQDILLYGHTPKNAIILCVRELYGFQIID